MQSNMLAKQASTGVAASPAYEACAPLWKRLPTSDTDGRPFCDFMMILPKLKNKPKAYVLSRVRKIQQVLDRFSDHVVFADYNANLNVLMVVLRPGQRTCWEIPSAINDMVPEALLVAQPRF